MALRIFTSITANYIPKARVLAHSIKHWHPEVHFTVVLSDEHPELNLSAEPFDAILGINDLGIPDVKPWMFQHSLVELSTAVKGFALVKLLNEPGSSEVLYFDPDIAVLSPLDPLVAHFETASILLTPHLTEPETTIEGIWDNELCALRHGVYNLGFVGVKKSVDGLAFAHWWADRLTHFCRDDIANGMFTDQRWIDLAPAYFDDLAILREPVFNVATWNLSRRKVEGDLAKGLTIDGKEIVFYHFSGLDSGAQMDMLNKYGRGMPGLFGLREWYLRECDRMGQATFSTIPWAFGIFENGEPIRPHHRKRYRDRGDLRTAFPDPFVTSDVNRSYYHWFQANDGEGAPHSVARRLWMKLNAVRA